MSRGPQSVQSVPPAHSEYSAPPPPSSQSPSPKDSHVLEQPLGEVSGLAPARRPTHLPNVLSREAVQRVLACLTGVPLLMAQLL